VEGEGHRQITDLIRDPEEALLAAAAGDTDPALAFVPLLCIEFFFVLLSAFHVT